MTDTGTTHSGATESEFVPFGPGDVIALVAATPALARVVGNGQLTAREVGDGNLNQVFIVTAQGSDGPGLVLKQALPYLRVAGEGWPLTRERMRFETRSLLLYNEIAPGLAPIVYDHDDAQSWVAMEYLGGHRIMRHGVIAGDDLRGVGRDVGSFVAALAHHTSEMSLSAPAKRDHMVELSNPALCHLQEEFVFTNPYFDSEENVWNPALDRAVQEVRADRALKTAIAGAKAEYMSNAQALLHGDLHSGSVMISADDGPATKVIDPEFAFYGPIAYDLGTFLANLAIGALAHDALTSSTSARRAVQARLIDEMRATWAGFVDGIEARWQLAESGDLACPDYWGADEAGFVAFRTSYLAGIAAGIGRQGGCEMLRRCMGIVSVADLEAIDDLERRAAVERRVIAVARRWLLDPSPPVPDLDGAIDHLIAPLVAAIAPDEEPS